MTLEEVKLKLNDKQTLALTLWGEARGEPVEGKIAVANVVRNRMKARNQTAKEVCLAAKQFSCWNGGDRNGQEVAMAATIMLLGGSIVPKAQLKECEWIADGILVDVVNDNIKGADHYMTLECYRLTRPSWASKMKVIATIGHHIFLKEV